MTHQNFERIVPEDKGLETNVNSIFRKNRHRLGKR